MNRTVMRVSVVLVLCVSGWAQEQPYELTVQGSGFFSKKTTGDVVTNMPTNSGGILAGFRFNVHRWFAFGADYDGFGNSQKYVSTTAGLTSIKTTMHSFSGSAVFKIPTVPLLRPYVLVGVAMMIFEPHGNSLSDQTRPGFVYGGGIDIPMYKHVALRSQYRGFVYSVPDFEVNTLHVGKHTHSAVPSVGLVFTF